MLHKRIKSRILSFLLAAVALALALATPAPALASVLPGYTSQVDYDNTDRDRYIIDIDLTNQLLFVRERESGRIVLQSICSTGMEGFSTFSGTFKLGHLKERAGFFIEFNSYALYWTQIARCVYIHSILFSSPSGTHKTMSRKTYNELNTRASHGCVRVLPDVAMWLFYNCPPGTECQIGGRKRLAELRKRLKYEQPPYESYYVPRDSKEPPKELMATLKRSTTLGTGVTGNTKYVCDVIKGEKVTMLQISPAWCKVQKANGLMGYILRRFLDIELDRSVYATIDAARPKAPEQALFLATPKRDGVYLFGEARPLQPKRDAAMRRLTVYSVLEVLKDEGKYFSVRYGHLTGYVLKSEVEEYEDRTR